MKSLKLLNNYLLHCANYLHNLNKMIKDFDKWNDKKKSIDNHSKITDFHEREIWWCSIGINVGHEQNSQTIDFSRPILIIKKFTREVFWGVPLTSKVKGGEKFRVRLSLDKIENDILLLQMRSYDQKRLLRKVCRITENEFSNIINEIKLLFCT